MEGNTVFISYILLPTTGETVNGYSQAIHCNYIKKIALGTINPYVQEISLNFPDSNDFKFLAGEIAAGIINPIGTGYTAHKIHALVQMVSNGAFNSFADVEPDPTQWKQINITPQVSGYSSGSTFFLTASKLTSVVFKIPLLQYTNPLIYIPYNLNYLNYPGETETNNLPFGEATYFFGNVSTKIKADVYTTDITINLPLNEFNSTSNSTWDGLETVYFTEIGIYDSNKNLVAIGKLNDPVAKNATIARTIVFALDF